MSSDFTGTSAGIRHYSTGIKEGLLLCTILQSHIHTSSTVRPSAITRTFSFVTVEDIKDEKYTNQTNDTGEQRTKDEKQSATARQVGNETINIFVCRVVARHNKTKPLLQYQVLVYSRRRIQALKKRSSAHSVEKNNLTSIVDVGDRKSAGVVAETTTSIVLNDVDVASSGRRA